MMESWPSSSPVLLRVHADVPQTATPEFLEQNTSKAAGAHIDPGHGPLRVSCQVDELGKGLQLLKKSFNTSRTSQMSYWWATQASIHATTERIKNIKV